MIKFFLILSSFMTVLILLNSNVVSYSEEEELSNQTIKRNNTNIDISTLVFELGSFCPSLQNFPVSSYAGWIPCGIE